MSQPASVPQYWDGVTNFSPGKTPLGFYDNDVKFQIEANRFPAYAASQFGWPTMAVELDEKSYFACLEAATLTYARELYEFQIKDNYGNLYGSSQSGSLSNKLVTSSLTGAIKLSKAYGAEAGTGGNVTYHKGSIDLQVGVQQYDLKAWATSTLNLAPSDSIEIKRIFYEKFPSILRRSNPTYLNTGLGSGNFFDGFGMTGIPVVQNVLLMPMNLDLLQTQGVELNDEIRQSHYGFELVNNVLKIFPIPVTEHKLFFEYIIQSERDSANAIAGGNNLITNPSQVPYDNITYSSVNFHGQQWIREYATVLAGERLANIRGKYKNKPIPGSEGDLQLNDSEIQTNSDRDRTDLLTRLREFFESTSKSKQLAKQADEAEQLSNIFANIPTVFYIG